MARLSRKTQKIFASNSAQNQVSTFGSIKAGAVAYSKDVSNIQTEAFEGGWSSAVQDDYAPYRQDRNAVDFVTTSQLAYVFQEGLPEYDANTTYYKGSWVKGFDGDAYVIYESLSDDNIGNNLSDEEKWEAKSFGGGVPVGSILPFGSDSVPQGFLLCNGATVSRTTYAGLFSVIGTTYGAGDGSTTFALPNYSSARMVTSATVGVKGTGKSLGITGGTKSGGWRSGESSGQISFMATSYGNTADKASGSQNPGAYYIGVVTNTANSGLTGTASLASACKFIIKY